MRTRIVLALLTGAVAALGAEVFQTKRLLDTANAEGWGVRVDGLPLIGHTTIDVGGGNDNGGPSAEVVLHQKAQQARARMHVVAGVVGVVAVAGVLVATIGD